MRIRHKTARANDDYLDLVVRFPLRLLLSGKRAISRASAVKLSHRFCIDVSAFLS